VKEARPAPQGHSLAPASIWLGRDLVVHCPSHALRVLVTMDRSAKIYFPVRAVT